MGTLKCTTGKSMSNISDEDEGTKVSKRKCMEVDRREDNIESPKQNDKRKQKKVDGKVRKSPRLEEKTKNKLVDIDDDDDFMDTRQLKEPTPLIEKALSAFLNFGQDVQEVVNMDEHCSKRKRNSPKLKQTRLNFGKSKQVEVVQLGSNRSSKPCKQKPRSTNQPNSLQPTKQSNGFRCTPTFMVSITKTMKGILPASHKEAIDNTPFKRLFSLFLEREIKKETMAGQNRNALCEIIRRYSCERDAFRFGEGENEAYIKFTPEHVALTFGLPLHGKKVGQVFRNHKFDPDKSSFLVENGLNNGGEITKTVMIEKVKSLMIDADRKEDFCRFVILLMAATIFFPNSNHTIGKSFAEHIEDFKTINSLSWPQMIYDYVMEKIRIRKEGWTPLSVSGCVIPLLVWLCETTKIATPRQTYKVGSPRIARWDFTELADDWKSDYLATITKDKINNDFKDLAEVEKELFIKPADVESSSYSLDYDDMQAENLMLKKEINRLEDEKKKLMAENLKLKSDLDGFGYKEDIVGGQNKTMDCDKDEEIAVAKVDGRKRTNPEENTIIECEGVDHNEAEMENAESQEIANDEEIPIHLKTVRNKLKLKHKVVDGGNERKVYSTRAKHRKEKGEIVHEKEAGKSEKKKRAKQNSEVIDVEKAEFGTSSKVDVRVLRDVKESVHWKHVDVSLKDKVLQFFSLATTNQYAYGDHTCLIKANAVEDIMFDKFTDAEVINFYTTWLKNHEEADLRSLYVSAYAWKKKKKNKLILGVNKKNVEEGRWMNS